MQPKWLEWAQNLQAIAQAGLTYTEGAYDRERYKAIQRIAAEILAGHTDASVDKIADLLAQESGYATPKIDVRGVIFQDNAILLVKERADGLWTLPGGWADVNESPSQCVEKEIWEESGYRATAVKLLAVYDRNQHPHPPIPWHTYKLFFLCRLDGGTPIHTLETNGVGFFREDDLPPLSVSRVTTGQIERMFDHYCHPDWPTDFD
ncbi:MAG: NUDIX hydrolase [Ardenticatenaceae bacterium]|nr:NUDIX hydrolase [Ardenticatenaceae bacterium]MCB9444637.1 NUDIX hydrolase [Ardenticatenaceae bacterium]